MNELALVVRQGLGLAVLLALPLVAAALLGSVISSVVAMLSGLQDPSVALIARAVAVVIAIAFLITGMADEAVTFTRETWSGLAAVGHGG